MKKNNALLVWKGRKLMCNGVCVAKVKFLDLPESWRKPQWCAETMEQNRPAFTEAEATDIINRSFGLKD